VLGRTCGPAEAQQLRPRRPRPGDQGPLDEALRTLTGGPPIKRAPGSLAWDNAGGTRRRPSHACVSGSGADARCPGGASALPGTAPARRRGRGLPGWHRASRAIAPTAQTTLTPHATTGATPAAVPVGRARARRSPRLWPERLALPPQTPPPSSPSVPPRHEATLPDLAGHHRHDHGRRRQA
jgi:hypothetical protein